jgi:diadenosine tetraphosphatase ApaH/serine/threonine PP2A family protein phosphatase
MDMVDNGNCLVCLGNHDDKLRRFLRGNNVSVSHGLDITLDQISSRSEGFAKDVSEFLESLPYKLILDDGKLVVTHAGLPEKYHDVDNKKARSIALYGKTTGKTDAKGFPERLDWAEDYTGDAVVVHGHVANFEPIIKNNVYNIDTACVFGGSLTALRYPEMTLVSIPASAQHCQRNF